MEGRIALSPEPLGNAKQIADAAYDPEEERLRVAFRDGTTAEATIKP
jgi:hypothetical protein